MKRTRLILVLVFLLSFVLSNAAMAASDVIIVDSASYDHSVTATYLEGSEPTTVYSVHIAWSDLSFRYDASQNMVWDDVKHEYVLQTPGWNNDGRATISVTNHSDVPVAVEIVYTPSSANIGVTGTITDGSFTLPSAEGKSPDDLSLTSTTLFTLSEQAPTVSNTNEPIKIGTITVTITDAEDDYE